jgi:signal transduction histidine kinase
VPPGHFGLRIMQERTRRFGGNLRIDSSPGGGTKVIAQIPRAAEAN